MIDEYLVLIKIGCPYSENAISLLKEKKQKHHVVDYFKLSKKMKDNVNELIKSELRLIDPSNYAGVTKPF